MHGGEVGMRMEGEVMIDNMVCLRVSMCMGWTLKLRFNFFLELDQTLFLVYTIMIGGRGG